MLPSATMLTNVCHREHALTLDAMNKQLQSQNQVSSALDRWTSTNKLAITSVIAYYIDWNWALCEVPLEFDKVDGLFFSHVER